MVKKYIKMPIVEAIKWTYDKKSEVLEFLENKGIYNPIDGLRIITDSGFIKVRLSDYIVKNAEGEFYPCESHVFKRTYKELDF